MRANEQAEIMLELRDRLKRVELMAYVGLIIASAVASFLAGVAIRSFLS